MATVFEMIQAGAIPGAFVWDDDQCFAILDINPVSPGHTLVIPKEPIDKWTDLPADLRNHLMDVAAKIARAQETAFGVPRSAVVIAGFEVPHAHIHVIPAASESAANLGNGRPATPEQIESTRSQLQAALGQ